MPTRRAVLPAATLAVACGLGTSALAAFPEDPPDDPLYDRSPLPNATNEQWDFASPEGGFDRGISADRAWRLSTGEGAVVADVDVGVDLDHPDLAAGWATNRAESGVGRRSNGVDDDGNGYVDDWRGWDFYQRDNDPTSDTENAHGTNVAGVLAAEADNGRDIAGVAPDARVLPIRSADNILHQGGRLAQAIVYSADRGVVAISMSLGADSFSRALRRAVSYAYRRGAVSVVASGNEFHFHHHYPQAHDDALAVGGVNPDTADLIDKNPSLAPVASDFTVHASYADYGPHLDLVAPVQVPTTEWGGGSREAWSGTSSATPHVAATVALVAARAREQGLRLSAGELVQILRMSADDLSEGSRGYAPGWDLLSGWGRVNAYAAVRKAERRRVPPVPDLESPRWYAPTTGAAKVRGSVDGRGPTSWTLLYGRGEDPRRWRPLARGSGTGGDVERLARLGRGRLPGREHTLLLRARDRHGNVGEDRAFFYTPPDRGLRSRFPRFLATSGESSPTLFDLDRDGGDDIVLAGADGLVRAYSGESGRMLEGWPVRMRPAASSGPTARRIGTVRPGFVATPAIGDVHGGRGVEVVAAGLDGRVYAWSRRGRRLRGFPFRIALRRPADQGRLDAAIYASPALVDLDRREGLEIVFGAADQRVYAIGGDGRPLPGWPVRAREGGDAAKILSSPAVADLDGDGEPEIVEGTGEAYGSTPSTEGRVYAFTGRGERVPGWPVRPEALAADSIPLVGEGVPVSPSVADVDGDGDDEVAVAAFTGQPELYDGDGSRIPGPGSENHFLGVGRGAASPASAPGILALGANGAFGRLEPGAGLGYFSGAVDLRLGQAQLSPATPVRFEHLAGGWDAASGAWLEGFPIPVEGWEIVTAPAIADVDGEPGAELIDGSSGNVLHAFGRDGAEPRGWPKQPGGWLLASPAVGDLDDDGRSDVVAVTRDGYLFAWDTRGRAGRAEWPSFRHDPRNTGNYGS